MDFQHLGGLRNVSVDLKYDVSVCVWHTRFCLEKERLEFCISVWFVLVNEVVCVNPT